MQKHSADLSIDAKDILTGWRYKMVVFTILFSVAGYFLFTLWGGWTGVSRAFSQVGIQGISFLLFCSFMNYLFRFARWQAFLRLLGFSVPTWMSFRIYCSGFALTTTPGRAGEGLRSILLKKYGIPYRRSLGALVAERFYDLIAVTLLALIGLSIYPAAQKTLLVVVGMIALVLIFLQKPSWMRKMESLGKRLLPTKWSNGLEFLFELLVAFRICFSLRIFIFSLISGVIAWGFEGAAFYYLLQFLGADISFLTALFIFNFSLLIGVLSFLPGGLGSTEITLWQLLLYFGVPSPVTVVATILIRFTTLWFAVLLGLLALPKWSSEVKNEER